MTTDEVVIGSWRIPGWQWRVTSAIACVGLGFAAYRSRSARHSQELAKNKYLLRVRSLALNRTSLDRNTALRARPTREETDGLKSLHQDIMAQVRCYLSIKMPDSLDRAEKCGYSGDVKVERRVSRIADAGAGVFVRGQQTIRAGEVVALYKGRVYTDNLKTTIACLMSGAYYRLWQNNSHVVSFGTSGGCAFTVSGLESPCFDVRKEIEPISVAAYINHPPKDVSPNVFFYGPVVLSKGNPNENQFPCGFAPECAGSDDQLAHAPIVCAVALRDLTPGEELLVDYDLGGVTSAPSWYSPVPMSLALPTNPLGTAHA